MTARLRRQMAITAGCWTVDVIVWGFSDNRYEGEWQDGEPHGRGKFTLGIVAGATKASTGMAKNMAMVVHI